MTNLKLGKLPDRTPAKIAITVNAGLNRALRDYATLYRATYGEAESVAALIPFMLEAFLDGDRAFAKARKGEGRLPKGQGKHAGGMFSGPNARSASEGLPPDTGPEKPARRPRIPRGDATIPPSSTPDTKVSS